MPIVTSVAVKPTTGRIGIQPRLHYNTTNFFQGFSVQVQAPSFQLAFFSPRYWPTWLGIILLYSISWLPYRLQYYLGCAMGRLVFAVFKSRRKIAQRNIELCFPNMTKAQQQQLLKKNIDATGIAIFETGIGWWWPEWRIRRISEVEGYEHIQAILDKGKGVLGLAIHNMNLEVNARVMGQKHPAVGFYRRHNNPLMEYMQYHGRNRSNKYMIHKRDVPGLIDALNNQELCLYLPDQDYGPKRCEFVPFFGVEKTATTTGTLLFANAANCETVFLLPLRTSKGYKAVVLPGLKDFPSGDDNYDVARVNKMVEEMIMHAPEQYLWMHKRFKTRPQGDSSLY